MQGSFGLKEYEYGLKGYEGLEAGFPSCLVCNGIINNPVCSDCLEKEALAWLSEINPEMNALLSPPSLSLSSNSGVSCILCSSEVDLCAHCYCNEVSRLLSNSPGLSREFLFIVNCGNWCNVCMQFTRL